MIPKDMMPAPIRMDENGILIYFQSIYTTITSREPKIIYNNVCSRLSPGQFVIKSDRRNAI